jgi:site-specific recombinase XerD
MRRWDGLLERYLGELQIRGLSSGTVTGRCRELDRWGSWLKHRRPRPALEEVGADEVVKYIRTRAPFRSKSTVANVVTALRSMGEFLVREEIWSSNPLRWMRGPKMDPRARIPRRIGHQTMEQLWAAAAERRQSYQRYLWLALLGVLYGTGLRRGELARLEVKAWNREEGVLRIDGQKTGRERQVTVPALTWRCLEAYWPQRQNLLEQTGRLDEAALFVNQEGGRLHPRSISQGLRTLARRCGLERITAHQFRHSCASDLLEGGVGLPQIQRMLGHQTITTTVRYLHVADPQRHEAVKLHPINRMLQSGGAA